MMKSNHKRRRLLMVSRAFYPCAAIGSHRAGKLVRYFGQLGWQPVVLTFREEYYRYCHPMMDQALMSQIPPDVEVVRTPYACLAMLRPAIGRLQSCVKQARPAAASPSAGKPSGEATGLARWVEVPNAVGWLPFGITSGLRHARRCDVVWATSPPTGGLCLGAILARLAGRPFVADFRDPWRGEGGSQYASRIHACVDRLWERFVLTTASRIVVVTEVMADEYRLRFPGHAHKIRVIYNGYDPEDFSAFADERCRSGPTRDVSIGYLGVLYQGRQEFMQRFFEGVRELNAGSGEFKVRVVMRGPEYEGVLRQARLAGIEQACDIGPPVPYREALRLMSSLDVMLVVGSQVHGYSLPGKVFEYIGARKPILAVTPEGALSCLVRENRIGLTVNPTDGRQVADAIREIVSAYPVFATHLKSAAVRFTRQETAWQTARLLDEVVNEASRLAGGATGR